VTSLRCGYGFVSEWRVASDEIAGDMPAATENAERRNPTSEFSSELWFASRGMPEAENLDAVLGFVHAIENFARPDR
jgi:hypothetical protein